MKFQFDMILRTLFLFAILSMLVSCNDDDSTQEPDNRIFLTASLSAPNQTGTNPDFVNDPLGLVPSNASGTLEAYLDLETSQLQDIKLNVTGILMSELKNFGPNSTAFHIHLPNSGNEGDFGFNVVDMVFGTDESNFTANSNGFEFTRNFVSILEADQGNFAAAGVHPGDDVIVDRLLNGFPFLIIHTAKSIFTNTGGVFPNGDPAPEGFPFAELRGEIRQN